MIMYALFAVSALKFMDTDYFGNTTIYTQAVADWQAQPWIDFVFDENGLCPPGYEPIYALWSGTSNGNITHEETVIVPNDSRYGHDYN